MLLGALTATCGPSDPVICIPARLAELGLLISTLKVSVSAWLALLAVVAFALYLALRYYRRRVIYRDLRMARIAPWELKERIDSGEDFMLLDLRNPLEWDQGIIPGATPIAADALATLASQLVEKGEVVLYCS